MADDSGELSNEPEEIIVIEGDEEGNKVEMTKERLQAWIKEMVDRSWRENPELQAKYRLLRSLLEKRKEMADQLLRLCECVAQYEVLVTKLFSSLGWEYKEINPEEERERESTFLRLPKEDAPSHGLANGSVAQSPQGPSEKIPETTQRDEDDICLKRRAVVVLDRLSESKIRALCRSSSPGWRHSSFEDVCSHDSDTEPKLSGTADSGDAGNRHTPPMKRRRTGGTTEDEVIAMQTEVVARKSPMHWERGRVVGEEPTADGRPKYTVSLEASGNVRVLRQHLVVLERPHEENLQVGTRVVVRCHQEEHCYRPGVVIEVPSRNNLKRYLVILDDHTPVYVKARVLLPVCTPRTEVCNEIVKKWHRKFMTDLLKTLPRWPMIRCTTGQVIRVERQRVQMPCRVEMIDCSLLKVVFLKDKHKEWIYRGSVRLEDVANLRNKQ